MLKRLLLVAVIALALVGTVSAAGKVYKVAFVARAQADAFAALESRFYTANLGDVWEEATGRLEIKKILQDQRIGEMERSKAEEIYRKLAKLLAEETAPPVPPPAPVRSSGPAPASPKAKVKFSDLSAEEVSFVMGSLRKFNKGMNKARLEKWVYDFPGSKEDMMERLRAAGGSHA